MCNHCVSRMCAPPSHCSWKLLQQGTWRGRNEAETCRITARIWSSYETSARASLTLLLGRSKLVLHPSWSLLVWGWPAEHNSTSDCSFLLSDALCLCFLSVNTLPGAGSWQRWSYNSIEIRLFAIENVWPIRNMRLLYLIYIWLKKKEGS